MEGFFDLREFVITLLKKLKFVIVFTLTISVLWGAARFVPLAIEYLTYEEPTVTEQAPVQESTAEGQPYRYQARKIVHVTALTSSHAQNAIAQAEPMEQIDEITSTYLVYARNKDFFQPLVDEFFANAKEVDAAHKEKMLEYNYRTKAVLSEEFLLQDFYNQISIESIGNSFVQISVTTGDKSLSETIVVKAEQILSQMVMKEIGKFDYTVMEATTVMSLPTPTAGLTPKVAATTTNVVAGTRPTLRYIVTQTVKGCIWGVIVGLILSIVFVLMFDVMSTVIKGQDDINQYGLRVLGTCQQRKKRLFGFVDRLIDKLEGNVCAPTTIEASCAFVKENLDAFVNAGQDNRILLTGCTKPEILESYMSVLRKTYESQTQITFESSASVVSDPQTLQKAKSATGVILVEEIGRSGRKDIDQEVDTFRALKKDILGFVLIK